MTLLGTVDPLPCKASRVLLIGCLLLASLPGTLGVSRTPEGSFLGEQMKINSH